MQANEILTFRAALEDARQTIMERARAAHVAQDPDANVGADSADMADATFTAAVAQSLDTAAKARLLEIEGALGRMEANVFGQCEACGEPIDVERLEARPWARRCMPCQQSIEGQARRDWARVPQAA
jgi:DnaK suppressor protein